MSIAIKHIERYYDYHNIEGEEMGQSDVHIRNIHYLVAVLKWLFHDQKVYVGSELNLYRTSEHKEIPICPDIVIIKGFEPPANKGEDLPSYYVGEDGPPPSVAIEVASPSTWKDDLKDKPADYAAFGVQQYFAFDPNAHPVWTGKWRNPSRLWGWQLNETSQQMQSLTSKPDGKLWSEQLESNLIVEDRTLHLYDRNGNLRLTEAESKGQQAENQWQRSEKLAAFLRQQGFDPDNLV